MQNKFFQFLISGCLLFVFCTCNPSKKAIKEAPYQPKIIQDGKLFDLVQPISHIKLKRKAFSIHFFSKAVQETSSLFHATQIASFLDKDLLDLVFDNQKKEAIPYLSPGTGLAAPKDKEYDSMYITDSGHHFIFYETNGTKRAQLIKKFSDGTLELKWEVNRFYYEDQFLSFDDLSWKTIYLVILYDQNHNEIVEKGEYYRVALSFE